ncbi:MAG: hypothetical protein LBF89_08605 [Bacteroidales bacterium]|jgi:hypothetical protein|nr:hypothetical protein [Bacteroidales bacterium]
MFKYAFMLIGAVLAGQTLVSCTCGRTVREEFVVPDSIYKVTKRIHEDVLKDVVDNLSSPIETASLFKSLNVPFSQKYVATTKHLSDYNTSYSKAFSLGVFGADLGYINMYGRTSMASIYIMVMKNLADGLNIGQFFNYATLKRLSDNDENIDSLVYISQQSFNKMDRYLRQSGRGNLSAIMISGVFVEALYLSCRFYEETANPRLAESIVEQKYLLAETVKMLSLYQSQKEVADLIAELSTIEAAFESVEIDVEKGKLEQIAENGSLRVVQNEKTIVRYTEAQLKNIVYEIENVRNKLINVN